jgi:hypothetical protein
MQENVRHLGFAAKNMTRNVPHIAGFHPATQYKGGIQCENLVVLQASAQGAESLVVQDSVVCRS